MSITERILFDYNVVFEWCTTDFKDDPINKAYKLVVCTELFDSIDSHKNMIADLSESTQIRLMELDNIFEEFYAYWIKHDETFKPGIESYFANFISSFTG